MERSLFGGSAADVAEDVDGKRVPGRPVTIWDGPHEGATRLMDLQDADKGALDNSTLVADKYGYIPPFYGPPGIERLWADAGTRRVELLSVNLSERFKKHTEEDPDPHKDREYTDRKFDQAVKLGPGNQVNLDSKVRWVELYADKGSAGEVGTVFGDFRQDGAGDRSNGAVWTLRQNGSVTHVVRTDTNIPLEVRGDVTQPQPKAAFVIGDGRKTGVDSQFRVDLNGNVYAEGQIVTQRPLAAPNVGTARVFSGPTPPADPKPGDVWIKYG
ncbi:hypothetical protein FGW37_05420 [Streptomyces rectiverticillatus]|uniref:hypothetical protein n=1 Tax=Streptomyces rectiverticillatus TaxID=173860 RepID=UPI0015C32BBA|nr:hypothetical protein [Streptomyces rectiverticillatus]QLE71116.1 hypothetical protein FGW37_05420 [Streptomyces rectiverticillatus]